MSKYCTMVLFGATYEDGVYIDALCVEPWEVAGNYYDLMQHASDNEAQKALFDSIPEPYKGVVDRACRAYHGMKLRAQFNAPRLNGPHVFHTDDKLADEFLVDWAKHNLFNRRKEKANA